MNSNFGLSKGSLGDMKDIKIEENKTIKIEQEIRKMQDVPIFPSLDLKINTKTDSKEKFNRTKTFKRIDGSFKK